MSYRKYELGSYEEMRERAPMGACPSATTSPRDVCDKHPRDKLAMVWEDWQGNERRVELGRAPGPLEQVRERARGARHRARGPRGHAAAVAARDRGRLPRHLQARRDPAVDVGALRRRGHPAPAERLGRQGARHRRGQPPPHPRRHGREACSCSATGEAGDVDLADALERGVRRLRGGRHGRRRPRPALLLVGHHRQGQGHPARAPLPARARGVRVLPRRAATASCSTASGEWAWAAGIAPLLGPWRYGATQFVYARKGGFDPEEQLRFLSKHGVTNMFTTPTALRAMTGVDGRGQEVPAEVPHRLLGRRAAQPRGDPLVPRAVRHHRARLLRADRVATRCAANYPTRRGARGLDGPADAGLGRGDPRRGREAAAARRARRDLPARALEPALPDRLLEPAGGHRGGVRRRLVPHQGRRRSPTRTATSGTPAAPTT